jgi:ribA/ribD-fused uncharacterized protein
MAIDSFSGPYRFLSNFYPAQIELYGLIFPTTEHAYQACKTFDLEWACRIQAATTPASAKRLGRKIPMREDWEQVKDQIMLMCLQKKFVQPYFREKLLATGSSMLIEGNTWGDRYWGVYAGEGLNKLGQLLMQVRRELR